MFKKIGIYVDEKHFGNKVAIYKSAELYMLIIKDREEMSYYLLDDKLERLYPINTLVKIQKCFIDIDNNHNINLDLSSFDFKKYGSSVCPMLFKNIVIHVLGMN